MIRTKNATTGGRNHGKDLNKDTTLALDNALTPAEFKELFKLNHIVRGSLNLRLLDKSTEVSEQIPLAMRKKASNHLNKKSAAMEHFKVDSVTNKEMVNGYETAQVHRLLNTALAAANYYQSDGRIEKLFVEHFPSTK